MLDDLTVVGKSACQTAPVAHSEDMRVGARNPGTSKGSCSSFLGGSAGQFPHDHNNSKEKLGRQKFEEEWSQA